MEKASMDANTSNPDYKDRTRVIAVIGILLLLVGIPVGFLGPLEMYSFYLFSEGGRFHYEGFGFGSFMFGNIASQIIGYYLIAAMLIPLGYGHLHMRRWARTLALTLLWFWLVVGAPLIVVVFFILAASKDLSVPAALIALVFLGLSYLLFPGLLIRFYRGQNVKRTFESKDVRSYWIEALPMPILVLCTLYGFYISTQLLQPRQSLSPGGSMVRHTYRDVGCYSDKERTWKTKPLHLKSSRLDPATALTRCSSWP